MRNALDSRDSTPAPPGVATPLVRWAVRSAADVVLDPGLGAATCLPECVRRLRSLGAADDRIAHQLHGIDAGPEAAGALRQALRDGGLPADLADLPAGTLFNPPPAAVDALIGGLPVPQPTDAERLRSAVRRLPEAAGCSRLTDPQCLLLIHAAGFLKPGGRLAVVLSDGWLDRRYGTAFKDYLLRTFVLRGVLGLQPAAFPRSPVRLVALLGEKRTAPQAATAGVPFVRHAADLPPDLGALLEGRSPEAARAMVAPEALKPRARWSAFLYAPDAYRALRDHPGLTPLDSLAHVRLGLQTFARPFYVVSLAVLQRWQLERRWLMPLLLSPRQLVQPRLSADVAPRHYVLACRESKAQLAGTRLLRYIEYWENQVLAPRRRGRPVVGVHNLPRVARTGRAPWYNLQDDLARRGTAPILLPRRLYRNLRVGWNQAGWVAGENFIEITPHAGIQPQALLAVLTASVSELALRVNADEYGGVYSLNAGSVGDVPVVDVRRLEPPALGPLTAAYRRFLRIGEPERGRLDAAVFAAAGLPDTLFQDLQETLGRLRNPAAARTPPAPEDESGLAGELRLL